MSNWDLKPWTVTVAGCNVGGGKTLTIIPGTPNKIVVNPGAILWGTFVYTGTTTADAMSDSIPHTITCIPGSPRTLLCVHLDDDRCHPPAQDGSCHPITASWTAMEGTGMHPYVEPAEIPTGKPQPGTPEDSAPPNFA